MFRIATGVDGPHPQVPGPAWRLGMSRVLLTMTIGAVGIGGCGSSSDVPIGKVFGTVTFQGKPVSEGLICFSNPSQGVYINANLKSDGTYVVEMAEDFGLPEGTYRVAIMSPPVDVPVGGTAPPPAARQFPNIPHKYHIPETSGLTLRVKEGDNPFDVDMKP